MNSPSAGAGGGGSDTESSASFTLLDTSQLEYIQSNLASPVRPSQSRVARVLPPEEPPRDNWASPDRYSGDRDSADRDSATPDAEGNVVADEPAVSEQAVDDRSGSCEPETAAARSRKMRPRPSRQGSSGGVSRPSATAFFAGLDAQVEAAEELGGDARADERTRRQVRRVRKKQQRNAAGLRHVESRIQDLVRRDRERFKRRQEMQRTAGGVGIAPVSGDGTGSVVDVFSEYEYGSVGGGGGGGGGGGASWEHDRGGSGVHGSVSRSTMAASAPAPAAPAPVAGRRSQNGRSLVGLADGFLEGKLSLHFLSSVGHKEASADEFGDDHVAPGGGDSVMVAFGTLPRASTRPVARHPRPRKKTKSKSSRRAGRRPPRPPHAPRSPVPVAHRNQPPIIPRVAAVPEPLHAVEGLAWVDAGAWDPSLASVAAAEAWDFDAILGC